MSWTSAYRAALRVLPAELRHKHGPAMEDLFARELGRAGARGSLRRALAGVAGILDVVRRAAYERIRPAHGVAEPGGGSVERTPAPQPTTRELLRRHAVSFVLAFAALTTALVAVFATRNMPALLGPRGATSGTVVEVLLLAVPFTAALTIPMASLVAVLRQLTQLEAEGTLAAAAGHRGGTRRLIVALLAASLAIATVELVLVAEIVPRANERLVSLLGIDATASNGRTMTIAQLQAAARSARAGVAPDALARAARYEVEIQKKLALPAACVVMALLGITVSLRVRRSGAWVIAGVSCAVFLGYYMVMVTGEDLANRRVISPLIGMWGANVMMLGVVLLALSRRRSRVGVVALMVAAMLTTPTSALAQGADSAAAATRAIYAAISSADTPTLRRLLSQNLRWISANSGAVVTKSQLLSAASRSIPDVKLEYQLDSVQSWRRGAIAGVDYVVTNRRTFRAYQTVFVSRASDTYVDEQGRWQLLRHVQSWIIQPPDTTSLDSLHLAAFVGRYDRGHGYIDDVHFREGHLVAQSTYEALMGAPGAHLFPVSAVTFSPERSAPMIVFERAERGRVIGYVQQQPDGTIARAPRLEEPAHPQQDGRGSDGFVTTADGIRLFYRVEGAGSDTVIAIHGGPTFGLGDLWPDLEWMTRRHVVIFYDLRGTGQSTLPLDTTALVMRNHVEDLAAIVQHFRLSRPVLVGHSFGGGVAALYAASHPGVVRRLVLLEPLSPTPAATRSAYQANLRARATPADVADVRRANEPATLDADPLGTCRTMQRVYLRLSVGTDSLAQRVAANWCAMSPESYLYAVRHLAPASDRTLATADYTEPGKAVRAPALVVAGSSDPWPWQVAEEWARILPDARLLLIPGAGHYAHAERRDLVEPAVEQFLQGEWPVGAIAVPHAH